MPGIQMSSNLVTALVAPPIQLHRRGLPGPDGAQQREELPAAHREGHPPDRIKTPATVPPDQRDRRCPPSPVPVTSAQAALTNLTVRPDAGPSRRSPPAPASRPHKRRRRWPRPAAPAPAAPEMARSAGMDGQAEPSPDAATATTATPPARSRWLAAAR